MKRAFGFTLIEVLVFIIVTGLVMTTILRGAIVALRESPEAHDQLVALQTAKRCMEYYLDQRRLNGYTALSCPSTPTAAACAAPSGFTVSNSVACTTWNGDTEFKTITVTVAGRSNAVLTAQIGDY